MLGSIFISETDLQKLQSLGQDLDTLEDFDHVSLDSLGTLDFETAVSGPGFRWMMGEPIFYDEEDGVALAKISPEGLAFVLNGQHEFDEEQMADLETLRVFVSTHGNENIVELATF